MTGQFLFIHSLDLVIAGCVHYSVITASAAKSLRSLFYFISISSKYSIVVPTGNYLIPAIKVFRPYRIKLSGHSPFVTLRIPGYCTSEMGFQKALHLLPWLICIYNGSTEHS